MTYAARESSIYGGQPVELYRFSAGLQVWTFTSAEHDRTYLSEVYRAAQVERDGVELSDELARSQLRITIPRDNHGWISPRSPRWRVKWSAWPPARGRPAGSLAAICSAPTGSGG